MDSEDGVIAITNGPIHRHEQGYYVEVEVSDLNPNMSIGCLGLGVTFMRPEDIARMPCVTLKKIDLELSC